MFQATRRRLALWYTTVTAVLLLLFGSGFYLYVRTTLIERIDDTLSHVVEVVQRSLVIEPTGSGTQLQVNVEASFRNNANTPDKNQPIPPTDATVRPMPRVRSRISWRVGLVTSNHGWLTRR